MAKESRLHHLRSGKIRGGAPGRETEGVERWIPGWGPRGASRGGMGPTQIHLARSTPNWTGRDTSPRARSPSMDLAPPGCAGWRVREGEVRKRIGHLKYRIGHLHSSVVEKYRTLLSPFSHVLTRNLCPIPEPHNRAAEVVHNGDPKPWGAARVAGHSQKKISPHPKQGNKKGREKFPPQTRKENCPMEERKNPPRPPQGEVDPPNEGGVVPYYLFTAQPCHVGPHEIGPKLNMPSCPPVSFVFTP